MQKLSDWGFSADNHESLSGEEDPSDEFLSSSYRLSDINVLSSTLSEVHNCPEGLL